MVFDTISSSIELSTTTNFGCMKVHYSRELACLEESRWDGGVLAVGALVRLLGGVPGLGEALGLERGEDLGLVLVDEGGRVAGKDEETDAVLVGDKSPLVAGGGADSIVGRGLGTEAEDPVRARSGVAGEVDGKHGGLSLRLDGIGFDLDECAGGDLLALGVVDRDVVGRVDTVVGSDANAAKFEDSCFVRVHCYGG